MAPYSVDFARSTRAGRDLLLEFLKLRVIYVLSDSSYNNNELIELGVGAPATAVIPPFHQTAELRTEGDDPATLAFVGSSAISLMAVGRLVPNKGFEYMIKALGHFSRKYKCRPTLNIIGSWDLRLLAYRNELIDLVAHYELGNSVVLHGSISLKALASYYRKSDVFWTASRHEGFCVPAIEAMAFGKPILSTTYGALPETCGDAAVFADDPEDMADQLNEILCNDALRLSLIRRGERRYRERFSTGVIRALFLETISSVSKSEFEVPIEAIIDDEDWFGLPHFSYAVMAAREQAEASLPYCQRSFAGRLDFVLWSLSEGRLHHEAFRRYFAEETTRSFAFDLELPRRANHFSYAMRLIWKFSRWANSSFPLADEASVEEFTRWFWREAIAKFHLRDLLSPNEMRRLERASYSAAADGAKVERFHQLGS